MSTPNSSETKAVAEQIPANQGLSELAEMAKKYASNLLVIEGLLEESKKLEAANIELSEKQIPEKMQQLGLEDFTLKNGDKVALQPVFGASVPDARKPEAWAWLRKEGHGALIKSTINMSFGMGEDDMLHKVAGELEGLGVPFKSKEDVHAATLKAFVTEQYEKGATFPEALFGAFTKTIARIKTNKKK